MQSQCWVRASLSEPGAQRRSAQSCHHREKCASQFIHPGAAWAYTGDWGRGDVWRARGLPPARGESLYVFLLQMTVLPYLALSLITGLGHLTYQEVKALALKVGAVLVGSWGVAFANPANTCFTPVVT